MWIKNAQLKIAVEYFENITTHVVALDENPQPEDQKRFEITGVEEAEFKVRVPKGCCVMGHQVDIVVHASSKENSWTFRSRAKVIGTEDLDDHQVEISISLHNDKDVEYQRFRSVLESRQDQVFELLRAVKGE